MEQKIKFTSMLLTDPNSFIRIAGKLFFDGGIKTITITMEVEGSELSVTPASLDFGTNEIS